MYNDRLGAHLVMVFYDSLITWIVPPLRNSDHKNHHNHHLVCRGYLYPQLLTITGKGEHPSYSRYYHDNQRGQTTPNATPLKESAVMKRPLTTKHPLMIPS